MAIAPPDPWTAEFAALWHPEQLAAAILIAVAYLQAAGPLCRRFGDPGPARPAQVAAFLAGIAALYAAQGSPLEWLANGYLLTAHMLQAVLMVFVAPPLLLIGLPDWLPRLLLGIGPVRAALARLTRPVTALVLFTVVFAGFLLPAVNGAALHNGWLYLVEHEAIVAAAVVMWWPVLSRWSEIPALSEPARLLYTFAVEVLMTLPFALITFADAPLFPTYARAPRVLPLSPLADQQLAGIVMRLGSMASFGLTLVRTFFGWARRQESLDPALRAAGPGRAAGEALRPQAPAGPGRPRAQVEEAAGGAALPLQPEPGAGGLR